MSRKWTSEENDKLTKLLDESKSHKDISQELARPESTIKTKAIIYAKSLVGSGKSKEDICLQCGISLKELEKQPRGIRKDDSSSSKKESATNTKKKDDLSEVNEKLDKIIELLYKHNIN